MIRQTVRYSARSSSRLVENYCLRLPSLEETNLGHLEQILCFCIDTSNLHLRPQVILAPKAFNSGWKQHHGDQMGADETRVASSGNDRQKNYDLGYRKRVDPIWSFTRVTRYALRMVSIEWKQDFLCAVQWGAQVSRSWLSDCYRSRFKDKRKSYFSSLPSDAEGSYFSGLQWWLSHFLWHLISRYVLARCMQQARALTVDGWLSQIFNDNCLGAWPYRRSFLKGVLTWYQRNHGGNSWLGPIWGQPTYLLWWRLSVHDFFLGLQCELKSRSKLWKVDKQNTKSFVDKKSIGKLFYFVP